MAGAAPGPHIIALQGASNCRDLGAIATTNRGAIRPGLLFRSDSLAEMTEGDSGQLEALGFRTVCDLEHESERSRKPNRQALGLGEGAVSRLRHLLLS